MEEELYEIASMRQFAGLSLARGTVPDETTILNFRHLLERRGLAREIFETVKAHLQAAGLFLRQSTIVDAAMIAAPSSRKDSTGERDPEMDQTKKGNQWYFGMKAHVGVDAESGLVHSLIGMAANVADVTKGHELLHGRETVAFGDAGYIGVDQRPERKRWIEWQVAMSPGKQQALRDTAADRLCDRIEHLKAQVRARGEHAFRVIKCQFSYVKVRYRGLTKNTTRLHTLFALARTSGWCTIGSSPQDSCARRAARHRQSRYDIAKLGLQRASCRLPKGNKPATGANAAQRGRGPTWSDFP